MTNTISTPLKSAAEKALENIPIVPVKNVIPPITDPMGKYWEQPAVSELTIDDTHALMSKESFDRLSDYSRSQPTGCYPGKMWKIGDDKGNWVLVWFGYSEKGHDWCSNNYRKILIA